ncbi:SHOCT domain-containing protein [Humisphaera borealis]|uniref:SHOCT domain-containing protein n=1 Tax=Humisphaera borealis TaxID=2807512 RepID=A0A7M2X0I0_9BACT|nr:SHOCT domain-containing protein [Humisphaera borealis]QOV90250.1 SHOCT domain-containing protein [Humisphaera borealis]
MQRLTDQGWQKIIDLSQRYGVSTDAVMSMLQSVVNGNGTMAQFYIAELGGGGQWMQGGITMVGDMFNYGLKSKVDGLCNELSQLLAQQPFVPPPPPQWQNQPSGGYASAGGQVSLFAPNGSGNWWPAEFGSPNGSGGQNNIRYAYFSNARRLAIEINGNVTIYDTLDHQIGGVSQQQGAGTTITLSSQYGTIDVASLPVVAINGAPPQSVQNFSSQNVASPYNTSSNSATPYVPSVQSPNPPAGGSAQEADIFAKIERLADLQQKGIVSPEEFAAKKAELLARL